MECINDKGASLSTHKHRRKQLASGDVISANLAQSSNVNSRELSTFVRYKNKIMLHCTRLKNSPSFKTKIEHHYIIFVFETQNRVRWQLLVDLVVYCWSLAICNLGSQAMWHLRLKEPIECRLLRKNTTNYAHCTKLCPLLNIIFVCIVPHLHQTPHVAYNLLKSKAAVTVSMFCLMW